MASNEEGSSPEGTLDNSVLVLYIEPQFESKPDSGNTLSVYGQGNDDGSYDYRHTGNISMLIKRQN